MVSSHDVIWTWEEEKHIPLEDRYPFCIRLSRFLVLQMILMCSICFLFGNDIGRYYNQCEKRKECFAYCNEDNYPQLICESLSTTITSGGNTYNDLYIYPKPGDADSSYEECESYIKDAEDFKESPSDNSRLERLDVCFPKTRYPEGNYDEYIVCVKSSEACENLYLPKRSSTVAGDFDVSYVFIGIAIANVFQYIYQFIVIYVIKIKTENMENMKIGSWKCFMQTFLLVCSAIVTLLVIWKCTQIAIYGYATELWITFGIALAVDQGKSLLFHVCVWYFLLRRCGYLKVTEDEFVNERWLMERRDKLLFNMRRSCGKVMDSMYYKRFSIILLVVYAVFVLLVLSIYSQLSDTYVLDVMDQVFISIFLFEILCNVFVQSLGYYKDYFNVFDTIIVLVSFIMFFVGQNTKGLAVLRLLRLVRLVIVLRKVSVTKRNNSGYATALEETLAILKTLKSEKKLNFRQKKELTWAIEIIESNKLYDVSIDQKIEKGSGQVSQDAEAKKWIAMATKTANDPLQWFDRDLDDYLYERKRDNDFGEDKGMFEEEFRQHVPLPDRTHFQLEKIFDDIAKWRFNSFQYFEMCGNQMIAHFIFRLFHFYDILRKFQVPVVSLKSFCNAIFEGYSSSNPYHNAIHAIDVTHRYNYFIVSGNLMKYISDLDIMAALLASVIHDFQHPGVNNEFLIKKSHAKAVRYNDISVLENHHLASAFAVLLDQNCDITIDLTEDQYWVLRTSIIKMVMSTDLKLQEDTIGSFKNYRGLPNFPNNDKEKQILMNMAMRISDYGNPLQPHDLYFKWMALMMEEFYQQGDIEDHLQMDYSSPFMNRRETNPYATQLSFINIVVEPMALIWVEFLPDIKEDVLTRGLMENKEILKQKSEQVIDNNDEEDLNLPDKKKRRDHILSNDN